MSAPLSAIFGSAGPSLSADERAFFRESNPLGYIVFARNVENPDQLRRLINDFRDTVGRDDARVLVDQEGGRVQRLAPPHWRTIPAQGTFATLHATDPSSGAEAARLNAYLIATELADVGITVDCLPVLDVPQPDAHDIIGDRAVGASPKQSAELGGIVCDALVSGGVLPVIKHIPGHGRARADSHHDLPVVDASDNDLDAVDFAPFKALATRAWGNPWAMTAHVIYSTHDADHPATTSAKVIRDIIRGRIGFDGVLVSDDLSMKALSGTFGARTAAALSAGCDIVLHCNGDMDEMTAVAEHCPVLTGDPLKRVTEAEAARVRARDSGAFDRAAAQARLDILLSGRTA